MSTTSRRCSLGLAALAAAATAVALSLGGSTGGAQAGPNLKPCPADQSANFDEYSAGPLFERLGRRSRLRQCDPPSHSPYAPPTRVNVASVAYGSCKPPAGDSGCSLPLEVQSWPACERNLSLYERFPGPNGPVPFTRTTFRGVPAAIFDQGERIEIYTGDATIVVVGDSPGRAHRAAAALRGVHGKRPIGPSQDLPEPEQGALDGNLQC